MLIINQEHSLTGAGACHSHYRDKFVIKKMLKLELYEMSFIPLKGYDRSVFMSLSSDFDHLFLDLGLCHFISGFLIVRWFTNAKPDI